MTFDLELPRELGSAAAARHAIGDLAGQLPEDMLGDVRLLVSELVTNSLRHAAMGDEDRIHLSIDVSDSTVRVMVRDDGQGFDPQPTPADPEQAEGWGLYLVSTLSDRWGVESGRGACVWFELDRVPSQAGESGRAA